MVKRSCCLIALLATCVACHKGTLTVPREIEEEIDSAIAKLGNLDVLRPWHGFDEKIRAISNRTVRVACYQMRSDKLESIEIVGEDFDRSIRLFRAISLGLADCVDAGRMALTLEGEYNAQIRHIRWMRRELDRVRAKKWKAVDEMDSDEYVMYVKWRNFYRVCLGLYENRLAMLERGFDEDCLFYRSSPKEQERVRKMIEKVIGRPVRTKAEIDADFTGKRISNEMRALL